MKRSRSVMAYTSSFVATLCFSVQFAHAQLKLHFINVGEAESILREFRYHAVLIDAGGEYTGDTRDRDHLFDYFGSEPFTPFHINKFGLFLIY